MRYLILNNNLQWDRNYSVFEAVPTVERRNEIIERIHPGWEEELRNSDEVHTVQLGDNGGEVQIESDMTFKELRTKKCIVLLEDDFEDEPTFYWIDERESFENNNMYRLTLSPNIILNYPGAIEAARNIAFTAGHIPLDNYINHEFSNVGQTTTSEYKVLEPLDKPEGAPSMLWGVIYRKLKAGEEATTFKIRNYRADGTSEILTVSKPFKIFAAPVDSRGNIDGDKDATIQDMTYHYNETENDGLTYAYKITNFEYDTDGTVFSQYQSSADGTRFVEVKEVNLANVLDFGTGEYDPRNTIDLEIPDDITSVLELMDGLNGYSLMIQGVKNFRIPIKYLFEEDGKYKLRFTHSIGDTPADSMEMIAFHGGGQLPEMDEEFTWVNNTELAVYVNQLNEYKAQNTTSNRDYLRVIGDGLLSMATGAIQGGVKGGAAGALVGVSVGALEGSAKALQLQRERKNMKNAPETVSMDGATYFYMANTFAPFSFVLAKHKFIGGERKALLDITYRYGLALENQFYFDSVADIKRPRFNCMTIVNFTEANRMYDLPSDVVAGFDEILRSSPVIWHDDNFKVYDDKWADNGEGIADYVRNKK